MAHDSDVWILGGYQSDFARNFARENKDFVKLTGEVVHSSLKAARISAPSGEMFASQGHLGAMPATVCEQLWDTPSTRHEAACASGSVATLAAIADLRSGAYETALMMGIELVKTVPGPYMFDIVAAEYDRRYGINDAHLHAIATLNFANARAHPSAQTRHGQCLT